MPASRLEELILGNDLLLGGLPYEARYFLRHPAKCRQLLFFYQYVSAILTMCCNKLIATSAAEPLPALKDMITDHVKGTVNDPECNVCMAARSGDYAKCDHPQKAMPTRTIRISAVVGH